MSAVAGLWRLNGRPDAAQGCERMLAAQEIYGPHAGAQWSRGEIALGRRLMRTLPEDAFDRQPLVGGGGRFVLVADLRLDNRDELARKLEIASQTAAGLSDAAILLAAFERWEETCLERVIGDYAFALWDAGRRRLLLARDPLGRRPLQYHCGSGFFAFASMAKGLHALPEVPCAPDEQKIAETLIIMPDVGSRTYFLGVERVEPAHLVTVTAAGLTSRRFWRPTRRSIDLRGPEEYAERARELLDEAVRCRLRGQRNVAVTLSGGLDSPGVAATAARLLAPSGGRVVAYTAVPAAGFEGPDPPGRFGDESALAAATAAMYPNMEHVLIHMPDRSPLDDLDRLYLLSEQPLQAICNLGWQIRLFEDARKRNLAISLGGSLGNLGLSYSGMGLLPELLRTGRWVHWWREVRALMRRERWSWSHAAAETLGPWFPGAAWAWLRRARRADITDVFSYTAINRERFAELGLARRARESGIDLAGRPPKDAFDLRVWCLNTIDFGTSLKGGLAGWHLDVREPLADLRMIEFCLAIPTEQFLRDGTPRALARLALADRVPKVVLENRRMGLGGADWHVRLTAARPQIAAELERLAACPAAARALDLPRLRRLVENWPSGGWERKEMIGAYRLALLRGISAGHFLRRATGGNS